jgi:hypothetical protein
MTRFTERVRYKGTLDGLRLPHRAARGLRRLARVLTPDRVIQERHPHPDRHWVREAMKRDTEHVFTSLNQAKFDVVEVSGFLWANMPWRSYTRVSYPEFDLCAPPALMPGPFDLVIFCKHRDARSVSASVSCMS